MWAGTSALPRAVHTTSECVSPPAMRTTRMPLKALIWRGRKTSLQSPCPRRPKSPLHHTAFCFGHERTGDAVVHKARLPDQLMNVNAVPGVQHRKRPLCWHATQPKHEPRMRLPAVQGAR